MRRCREKTGVHLIRQVGKRTVIPNAIARTCDEKSFIHSEEYSRYDNQWMTCACSKHERWLTGHWAVTGRAVYNRAYLPMTRWASHDCFDIGPIPVRWSVSQFCPISVGYPPATGRSSLVSWLLRRCVFFFFNKWSYILKVQKKPPKKSGDYGTGDRYLGDCVDNMTLCRVENHSVV